MKQLKSFPIILLTLTMAPIAAFAEQSTEGSKPHPPITLQRGNWGAGSSNRPKAPERQSITCTYDGTAMKFNFTVSEGISTLTVTDETPKCVIYTIDTSTLEVTVPIGSLSGLISIDLDTECGNHYSGIME